MSASLVGSEMCIRDSTPVPRSRRWARRWRPPTPPCAAIARACSGWGPVSYTHLTLPTICSV
eukprot:3554073-Alexandrium_andersonii.AAC.1